MRSTSLVLCFGLIACGSDPAQTVASSTPVTAIARDPSSLVRCVVRDPLTERSTIGPRETTIAVGGTTGSYWLTSAWLVRDDGRGASAINAESAAQLAGDHWLSFARGSLVEHQSASDSGRPVRALANACDVRILGTSAGAFVIYRRSAQGCVGGATQGPVTVLRVSANAQQFDTFSPLGEEAVASLDARLDSGRIVIETTVPGSRETRSLVLDLEGGNLGQHAGSRVVCPLSGCLSVRAERDGVQFSPMGASTNNWFLSTMNGPIRALAVYADRVLVAQQEATGPRHSLFVIDAVRRRVETVYDSRSRSAVDVWSEPLQSGTLRVAATDRGFAALAATVSGDLFVRDVDCEP